MPASRPYTLETSEVDLMLMKRAGVGMFWAGGTTQCLGIFTEAQALASQLAGGILAMALFACALFATFAPPSARLMRTGVFAGVGLLSAIIATSDAVGMASLFYLWPVLLSAYFFSKKHLVTTVGFAATGLAMALHLTP
ncbi:MAG: hypothetical protein J7513_01160, partial [Solirubrobacteraceae bacterium]|nr:hypothetical protein [Solirubrobacteraceae bacterium]